MTSAAPTVIHVGGRRPNLRQFARELLDLAAALPLFVIAPFIRRWHRRWGATDDEVSSCLPGDTLVPGCQYSCTRAIEIAAPPKDVWPWLLQIGFGRAGFYSNDLLDNVGHPSAEVVIPELQQVNVGDWVPMFSKVNDTTAFRVVELFEPFHLLWAKPDSTWSWQLTPSPRGTRLVTRLRILYRWDRPAEALFSLFLNEFGDFPMMRRMLLNLKRNVENLRRTHQSRGAAF